METVTWNDDKIDAGFARLEARMDLESALTDERFKAVNQQLGELKTGQAQMNERFDSLNRTLLQIGGGVIGTLIAGMVTVIVFALTQ
jgi:hypothetical protein